MQVVRKDAPLQQRGPLIGRYRRIRGDVVCQGGGVGRSRLGQGEREGERETSGRRQLLQLLAKLLRIAQCTAEPEMCEEIVVMSVSW